VKLDSAQILDLLPHRYPFLLVDRVDEIEPLKRIVGVKNVTLNEPFFQGHFPGQPVMPGVLIIEAMAQVAAVLILHSLEEREKKLLFFTGIESARFRKSVEPGDQLRIEMHVLQLRSRASRLRGVATVDGQMACEAEILAVMGARRQVP
jgi:beta-hydroxyacyl-ACP dehydratase FabZ